MVKNLDKYSIDNTDYSVGQDNIQKWGVDIHNSVFGTSAGLIILLLTIVLFGDVETTKNALTVTKDLIFNQFDWFFVWTGHIINILSVIATLFGLVASLGLL